MANFSTLKDKQDALVFAALDCLVLVKPYDGTFPDSVTDADGGLKDLTADGFKTIGEFQKDAGVGLSFSKEVDGPEGYGSRGKRRYITSSEGLTITVTAQEHRLSTLGIVYDANTKEIGVKGNQEDGGFILKKNRATRLPEYTVLVIGVDGESGEEIYPLWIIPKATMTSADDVTLSDSGALEFGLTFEATESAEYGALYGFGYVGPGMGDGQVLALMAGKEPGNDGGNGGTTPTDPENP